MSDLWIQCGKCGAILNDAMSEAETVVSERDMLRRQVEIVGEVLKQIIDASETCNGCPLFGKCERYEITCGDAITLWSLEQAKGGGGA